MQFGKSRLSTFVVCTLVKRKSLIRPESQENRRNTDDLVIRRRLNRRVSHNGQAQAIHHRQEDMLVPRRCLKCFEK